MTAKIALPAKSTAITIVVINKTFSKPLRVVCSVELSPPPNAAPAPAEFCCKSIVNIRMTDSVIWIHGRRFWIIPIKYILS